MGFLNGLGGANPTAQSLAQKSMNWGQIGAQTSALGSVLTGVENSNYFNYKAKLSGEAAGATWAAGQYAEGLTKAQGTRNVAEQTVEQAANGIEVGSGSALAVRQATANVASMDAAMLHYNAAREAYGYDTSAALEKKAGRQELVKGVFDAGSSLLGGARSLSDKWLRYQQSGAVGGA